MHNTVNDGIWGARYVSRIANRRTGGGLSRAYHMQFDMLSLSLYVRGELFHRTEEGATTSGTIWYKAIGTVPQKQMLACGGGNVINGYQAGLCETAARTKYYSWTPSSVLASYTAESTFHTMEVDPSFHECELGAPQCCPLCFAEVNGNSRFCRYPPVALGNNADEDAHAVKYRLNRLTHAWLAMKKIRRPLRAAGAALGTVNRGAGCQHYVNAGVAQALADCNTIDAATNFYGRACTTADSDCTNQKCPVQFGWVSPIDSGGVNTFQWGDINSCYNKEDWESGLYPVRPGSVYWNYVFLKTRAQNSDSSNVAQIFGNQGSDYSHWQKLPARNKIVGTEPPLFDYHSKTEPRFFR
jgi:hypothetical protein